MFRLLTQLTVPWLAAHALTPLMSYIYYLKSYIEISKSILTINIVHIKILKFCKQINSHSNCSENTNKLAQQRLYVRIYNSPKIIVYRQSLQNSLMASVTW